MGKDLLPAACPSGCTTQGKRAIHGKRYSDHCHRSICTSGLAGGSRSCYRVQMCQALCHHWCPSPQGNRILMSASASLPSPSWTNIHLLDCPRILITAPSSGAGKTSLSLGLMTAFTRRGMAVQPFKAGPDYMDSALHAASRGRPAGSFDPKQQGPSGSCRCGQNVGATCISARRWKMPGEIGGPASGWSRG